MADVSKLRLGNTSYDIKDDNARRYLVMINEEPVSATKMVVETGEDEDSVELAYQEDLDSVEQKVDWFVTPEMFGAVGDGITDDTFIIQNIINTYDYVLFSNTYLITGLTITNRSGLVMKGANGVFKLTTACNAITLSGTNSDITIDSIGVIGSGSSSIRQIGIAMSSGNSIENLMIKYCTFDSLACGVTINADTSGNVSNVTMIYNTVRNIKGVDPGYGYGLLIADGSDEDTNSTISYNLIDNCDRHSIYIGRGRTYRVIGNKIINHRKDVHSGVLRPAINIGRSNNVVVSENMVEGYDGLISTLGDNNTEGYPLNDYSVRNIIITNNTLTSVGNDLHAVYIGYTDYTVDGYPQNIVVDGNTFKGFGGITVKYGKKIVLKDNVFDGLGTYGIALNADGESDDYEIRGNRGNNMTTALCILTNTICTGTVSIILADNLSNTNSYYCTASITNTNVSVYGKKAGISYNPNTAYIPINDYCDVTVTGTTGATYGELSTGIPSASYDMVTASISSPANVIALPYVVNNNTWYIKALNMLDMTAKKNTAIVARVLIRRLM